MFIMTSILAFSSTVLAQTQPPDSNRGVVLGFPETVVTQVFDDGKVAAAGPKWKAIVASDKATFVPVLGKRAPRNLPLEFGIPQLSVGGTPIVGTHGTPQLAGNSASVDHGPFSSVYDFTPQHVEQSVLVDGLPVRGELTVRIPLRTDLGVTDVADGLRFDIPGFGAIHYGDATIIDRRGRRVGAFSAVRDGAIEIRVPASFVESAEFPILVDPAITPDLDIDESTSAFDNPEVAWDSVHDLYTVLFERENSGTESDLFVNRVSASTGAVLTIAAVDLTSNHTTEASIANAPNNQNYLCVWRKDPDGIFDDVEIRGARITTGGGASSSFTISTSSSNESSPDVGGSNTNSTFLVVWEEDPIAGGGGRNIVARTVNAGSLALGSKIDVADSSDDEVSPRVNKQSTDGKWTVVWEERNAGGDSDIKCALFNVGSMTSSGNFVSVSPSNDDLDPHVTQLANGDFVFAWTRIIPDGSPNDVDIMTRRFQSNAVSYNAVTSTSNLTKIASPTDSQDQSSACVCANGTRVLYAFKQGTVSKYTSADYDGVVPVPIEKNINVNDVFGASGEGRVRLAARGHTNFTFDQFLAVYATGGGVAGQFFESNSAGGVTFVQTGCGGVSEPRISLTGSDNDPLICEPFAISISGFSSNALLIIGPPANLPICPAQSTCVLGASPSIVIPIGNGVFDFTIPCDAALLSGSVALCGISLGGNVVDPGCKPPAFSQIVRTSDTMLIDFQ